MPSGAVAKNALFIAAVSSPNWDSARIDLLWAPLPALPGGKEGNERGNPHIDVDEIMSLARESVPAELLSKWNNGNYPRNEPAVAAAE